MISFIPTLLQFLFFLIFVSFFRFKMKPLKTKNEVDSSMKSTIRYTFVAPGAIGKGRGRGLKSLAERRNLSTKSYVSQSSDLVNQYIQEIETSKKFAN